MKNTADNDFLAEKSVIMAACLAVLVTAYLVAGLVRAFNPGPIFTNWFHTTKTFGSVQYSLWESIGSGGKIFLIVAFMLPWFGGLAVVSRSRTARRGVIMLITFLVGHALACLCLASLLTHVVGKSAVSDSLWEIAKFLGVSIAPAGVAAGIALFLLSPAAHEEGNRGK